MVLQNNTDLFEKTPSLFCKISHNRSVFLNYTNLVDILSNPVLKGQISFLQEIVDTRKSQVQPSEVLYCEFRKDYTNKLETYRYVKKSFYESKVKFLCQVNRLSQEMNKDFILNNKYTRELFKITSKIQIESL